MCICMSVILMRTYSKFRSVQRGVKIDVLEIKGGKASVGLGEYTVDEEFDKFE